MKPILNWFDGQENRKGILNQVGALEHTEEINGDDVLKFYSEQLPNRFDRIVWRDPEDGRWREHVVEYASRGLTGACTVRARSSLESDLRVAYIVQKQFSKRPVPAVRAVLADTGWSEYDSKYWLAKFGFNHYHKSVYSALQATADTFSSEFEPVITVGDSGVTSRQVRMYPRLGQYRGMRFATGRNLRYFRSSTTPAELFTALYGWGAALPRVDEEGNYTGGYTRRIGFAEINDGVAWVGDEEARLKYGIWNRDHTELMHRFGEYISYSSVPENVLDSTKFWLSYRKRDSYNYIFDVALSENAIAGLGDPVTVLGIEGNDNYSFQARILKRVRTIGETVRSVIELGSAMYYLWNKNRGVGAFEEVSCYDDYNKD